MPKIKITETLELLNSTVDAPIEVAILTKSGTSVSSATYSAKTASAILASYGFKVTEFELASTATDITDDVKNKLLDKNLYDIRFLHLGDFIGNAGMRDELAAIAEKRGDCVVLVDCNSDDITADDIRDTITGTSTTAEFKSEYATGFAPWWEYHDKDYTLDLPGSMAYLLSFARSVFVNGNNSWDAVAGVLRGIVPGMVEPVTKLVSADVDALQRRAEDLDGEADNEGIAINPICYVRPAGNIIWGNRTLRETGEDEVLQATSFLNIRNLICEIKKKIYEVSNKLTFEQNDDVLWFNFISLISPLLDKMKSSSGIGSYKFIKEETDKKARLHATIKITPIEAVEDFEIDVYLANELE